jgi:hypothetical protein
MENEVKASDLIKVQQEKEVRKTDTYYKIYKLVEKKICIASSSNLYYTWYQIPEFFVGLPLYSLSECINYIENKLSKNGFTVEYYEPNILLIKWFST